MKTKLLSVLTVFAMTITAAFGAWKPGLQWGAVSASSFSATAFPTETNVSLTIDKAMAASWPVNTMYVYWGQIYLDGSAYRFGESIDDEAMLKINGMTVFDNRVYNAATFGTVELPEGWYSFELRMRNGSSGGGPNASGGFSATKGFGFAKGTSDEMNAITSGASLEIPLDPGDASLLRYDDGLGFADLIEVSGYPSNFGVVSPAYGSNNGYKEGDVVTLTAPASWTSDDGSVSASCTGAFLYEVDIETGEKTLIETIEGTSYTHTHGTKMVEVVWQWEPVRSGDPIWVGRVDNNWNVADNWKGYIVPTAADNVVLSGVSLTADGAITAGSLTLTDGASLRVEGADDAHVGITVTGDIEIGAESTLKVLAGRCTGLATNFPTLYAEANIISARDIHVSPRGTLVTASDILTGVPVFIKCENFVVDPEGLVDATSLGYGWIAQTSTLPDDGIKTDNGAMTYAPGRGQSYGNSGGYGGCGNNASYGKVYGYKYAPWMPGSPNGIYYKFANWTLGEYGSNHSGGWVRGGGNIRIDATGRITVGGEIRANCYYRFYGAGSGGGIWLTANNYTFYGDAFLQARGGDCARNYQSSGGGGRISIGAALTAEEIASLATGATPEALTYGDAPAFVKTDVLCGENHPIVRDPILYPRGATKNRDGTSTYVLNTNKVVAVKVAMTNEFGHVVSSGGLVEDAAGGAVIDVNDFNLDASIEYTGAEWTLTDSTGTVVDSGAGNSVTLPASTAGNLTLTWSVTESSTAAEAEMPEATGTTLTFIGASGAAWEDGANWSNGAVPTLADGVTLSEGQFVVATSVVEVAALTIAEGATLAIGGTISDITKQVGVSGIEYGIVSAGDVTVDGSLSVGGTLPNYNFGYNKAKVSIGGNLTLNNVGAVAFYASRPSWPIFTTYDPIKVYKSRTEVTIGGDLILNGSSVLYTTTDNLTGAAVRIKTHSVTVAAEASINAVARGFGAVAHYGELPIDCTTYPDGYNQWIVYGYGQSWAADTAAYGGRSYNGDAVDYGFVLAPYMPGSPPRGTVRGGGAIWIEADGQFTHYGSINANGTQSGSRMSSGGGIWIMTRSFVASATATVTADAGTLPGVSGADASGGGRITIVEGGYTDKDIIVFAAGETPEGYTIEESSANFVNSVSCGEGFITSGTDTSVGKDGTFRYLTKPLTDVRTIVVSGDPINALNDTVTYGTYLALSSSYTFNNEAYAMHPNGESRMPCVGYIVTNETGTVIASGGGTTVTFRPDAEGNTYVVWRYGAPIPEIAIDIPDGAGGKVQISDAQTLTESSKVYLEGTDTVTALPDEGYEFLYWLGEVPAGKERDAKINITDGVKHSIRPLFRPAEAKTTRYWLSAAKGSWYDSANWEGGVVPGINDDVIITNGVCFTSNYVETASITLTDNARLYCGGNVSSGNFLKSLSSFKDSRYILSYADTIIERIVVKVKGDVVIGDTAEFAVGGVDQSYVAFFSAANVVLNDNAKMLVAGSELKGDYTHQTGSGFVDISGKFTLNDESAFYPLSAGYTGGSVVVNCDIFTLTTNAMVNANGLGYSWYPTKTPQALAPGGGNSYHNGAGHGGVGASRTAIYGNTYDYLYAPIMPGSGVLAAYSGLNSNIYPGGGVIRIHARNCHITGLMTSVDIKGLTYVQGVSPTTYNAGSGGSIWVTAEKVMRIYPGARFIARGRDTNYGGSKSGGGRISLGRKISPYELDSLVANGDEIPAPLTGKALEVLDNVAFTNLYNNVEIDVRKGGGNAGKGTFVFLDGGTMDRTIMILR